MKCDSVDIFSDSEIANWMQKSSNDCANEVTKNIISKNNANKAPTNIKEKLPTQDINKSLDERSHEF